MSNAVQNTTTRPTLSLDSTGEDVKYLQIVLNVAVVANSLVVDGVFGQKTKEAVMAFQKDNDLYVDGIVGTDTWRIVDDIYTGTPTLRRGSKGVFVKMLQTRLNERAFGPLVVDGEFGPATEEAVKKLQQSHSHILVVDGIVGESTWGVLNSLG